jgi:hypothetical protein
MLAVLVLVVAGVGVLAALVATYGRDTNVTERVAAGGTRVVPVTLSDLTHRPLHASSSQQLPPWRRGVGRTPLGNGHLVGRR